MSSRRPAVQWLDFSSVQTTEKRTREEERLKQGAVPWQKAAATGALSGSRGISWKDPDPTTPVPLCVGLRFLGKWGVQVSSEAPPSGLKDIHKQTHSVGPYCQSPGITHVRSTTIKLHPADSSCPLAPLPPFPMVDSGTQSVQIRTMERTQLEPVYRIPFQSKWNDTGKQRLLNCLPM